MTQFSHEDDRGIKKITSNNDVTLESDRDQDGSGDIVLRTGGVERARVTAAGVGFGLLGGSQTFLPASNGTDDTSAIQAILTAGGNIVGKKGESYKISASLVISSNTRLDLTGCTITLNAGSNCNMLHNAAWVAGSGTDTNIEVIGGTWTRGTNAGGVSVLTLHTMILQRVTGLSIHDLSVNTSTGAKFAINVYACTNFAVQRITFNTYSDGVHMSGTCTNGYVADIWGSTGDDSVAITTVDYAAYNNGDLGNASGITIERVYTNTTGGATGQGNGVRLIAGNIASAATTISDVSIRDIKITATSGNPVQIGGDNADAGTFGGVIMNVSVDRVATSSTTRHCVVTTYGTFRGLVLSRLSSPQGSGFALQLTAGTVIEDVTIRDCYLNPPAGIPAINFVAGGTNPSVTLMRVINSRLNVQSKSAGLISTNGASVVLTELIVENLYVDQAAHAVADIFPTVNVRVRGVKAVNVNDWFNVRAGGVVNVLEWEGNVGNVDTFANAGTVNFNPTPTAVPAYSASITPDAHKAPWQTITVTNGTAFTINAPTFSPDSTHTAELTIEISNTSGGAMGAITWNAIFKLVGGAFTNPATGFKRFIRFEWNGVAWVETSRASADY